MRLCVSKCGGVAWGWVVSQSIHLSSSPRTTHSHPPSPESNVRTYPERRLLQPCPQLPLVRRHLLNGIDRHRVLSRPPTDPFLHMIGQTTHKLPPTSVKAPSESIIDPDPPPLHPPTTPTHLHLHPPCPAWRPRADPARPTCSRAAPETPALSDSQRRQRRVVSVTACCCILTVARMGVPVSCPLSRPSATSTHPHKHPIRPPPHYPPHTHRPYPHPPTYLPWSSWKTICGSCETGSPSRTPNLSLNCALPSSCDELAYYGMHDGDEPTHTAHTQTATTTPHLQ